MAHYIAHYTSWGPTAEILRAEEDGSFTSVAFMQGDDVAILENGEEAVTKIWTRRFGKGYRKSYGPFRSLEEHLDYVYSQYDI